MCRTSLDRDAKTRAGLRTGVQDREQWTIIPMTAEIDLNHRGPDSNDVCLVCTELESRPSCFMIDLSRVVSKQSLDRCDPSSLSTNQLGLWLLKTAKSMLLVVFSDVARNDVPFTPCLR